jgi:hypothetical protein
MSTSQTQAQMDPGVASFDAVFTYMLVGFPDFDLAQMCTFGWHRILQQKEFLFRSSDLGHVTKGHNHIQDPRLSITMDLEVFICVASRLSILRINHRLYDSGGTTVLGRLGLGRRQWRNHMHYRIQNGTVGIHSCQSILYRDERDQPACVAEVANNLRSGVILSIQTLPGLTRP